MGDLRKTCQNRGLWEAGLRRWGSIPGLSGWSFLMVSVKGDNEYVLTAAHCIKYGQLRVDVILGDQKINFTTDARTVKIPNSKTRRKDAVHPDYDNDETEGQYDFALFKLAKKISWKDYHNIRPICLPTDPDEEYVGRKAIG